MFEPLKAEAQLLTKGLCRLLVFCTFCTKQASVRIMNYNWSPGNSTRCRSRTKLKSFRSFEPIFDRGTKERRHFLFSTSSTVKQFNRFNSLTNALEKKIWFETFLSAVANARYIIKTKTALWLLAVLAPSGTILFSKRLQYSRWDMQY